MPQKFSPETISEIAKAGKDLRERLKSERFDTTEDNPPSAEGDDGLAGDREPRDPKIPPSAGAMALELVDNE